MKVRYVCSDGLVHSDPVNGESEGVTKNERRQARVVYGPCGITLCPCDVRRRRAFAVSCVCVSHVKAEITDVRAMSSHDSTQCYADDRAMSIVGCTRRRRAAKATTRHVVVCDRRRASSPRRRH